MHTHKHTVPLLPVFVMHSIRVFIFDARVQKMESPSLLKIHIFNDRILPYLNARSAWKGLLKRIEYKLFFLLSMELYMSMELKSSLLN